MEKKTQEQIDKLMPTIKPKQQKEVSVKTQQAFFVKKLIQKFNDIDSEIARLEEEQIELLEKLEELGTVQCPFCYEFVKKQSTIKVESGFICKSCLN